MKYLPQLHWLMAAIAVVIAAYTFSNTFWNKPEFQPISIREVAPPAAQPPLSKSMGGAPSNASSQAAPIAVKPLSELPKEPTGAPAAAPVVQPDAASGSAPAPAIPQARPSSSPQPPVPPFQGVPPQPGLSPFGRPTDPELVPRSVLAPRNTAKRTPRDESDAPPVRSSLPEQDPP